MAGWRFFTFENNQTTVIGAPSIGWAIDYDDMVVYTSTPPNIDANGNPCIGP
jgi:hypothetical protein